MRFPAALALPRAAAAFLTRQASLSTIFAGLVLAVTLAQALFPIAHLRTSLGERAGLVRIRDARALLTAVTRRQVDPMARSDIAPLARRVIGPYRDSIALDPADAGAVARAWAAARVHPGSGAALSSVATVTADLISRISDASKLTYDDDVDAINLGDAYAAQLPIAFERLAQAVRIARRPVPALTIADRLAISRLVAQANVGWRTADGDVALALATTGIDVKALDGARSAAQARFVPLQMRLDALAERPAAQDATLVLPRYRAFAKAYALYDDALDAALDRLLARRVAGEWQRLALDGILALIAIVLGNVVMARFSQSILQRERRALQIETDRASALENELRRRRAERENVLNEAQFRTIFDGSPLGIATVGSDGKLLERNPVLIAMLEESFDLFDATFDAAAFARLLAGDLPPYQVEREIPSGAASRWIDLTVFPIRISRGESIAAIAMIADVTERKSSSERLRYDATHDALTGLRSRGAFLEELARAIERPSTDTNRRQAVMLIDLDRFKIVNDTLGHAAGDDVLVIVAKRLRDIVRPSDVLGRLHGDEFVLLVSAGGENELTAIAERAQNSLRAPIIIEGEAVCIDSSVGICVAQSGGRPDELVRNADTAMYHAKRMGRGRHVYFDGAMHDASARYLRLASEMPRSLERGEFRVEYQPIVVLADATIHGFEALLRWSHLELGEISPVEFIAIAEETGAIVSLGRFVLEEACRQVARWDWEHRKTHRVTMSVNLSVCQLENGIVADVERSLREAGIAGNRLNLEITESALLESGPRISEILSRLRCTGARLCLDDFGTGYSSLRYLQQFPFDQLKIDRSFVGGGQSGLASEPIVRMLLNLAESLHLEAIAEGIESEAENEQLIALGCRFGQGFRFSPARLPRDIVFDGPLGPRGRQFPILGHNLQ